MPLTKKQNKQTANKKTVIVTKTKVAVEDTLFPEKAKQVNKLLAKAKLLPS